MLKNFSWLYALSKPLGTGSGKRCHAEQSPPVAFDRVLMERIFPVDQAGCDAGIWVFIKALDMQLCGAMGSTVNCAAAEQLKLESIQLLSHWVYNAGRHPGQGPNRSQIA